MQDERLTALHHWLSHVVPTSDWTLKPLAGDASFRRYFRLQAADHSWIVMDAPPGREDVRPFVAVANAFKHHGVQVPLIIAEQLEQGFLLLSDLGDDLLLNCLNANNVDQLYQQALTVLTGIQACSKVPGHTLPYFDQQFVLREWNLFYQWVIEKHWALSLTTHEQHVLANALELLTQEVLAQPQICVHRDYHSRNLLLLKDNSIGVLDFQDAVWGPITYDAVSLLRDCYVAWPRSDVERWALLYYEQTLNNGLLKNISSDQFMRWFDWLGIQRHLKAAGIFARLKYLYHKPNYIHDIPRTLNYILQVSENYVELKGLRELLEIPLSRPAATLLPPSSGFQPPSPAEREKGTGKPSPSGRGQGEGKGRGSNVPSPLAGEG